MKKLIIGLLVICLLASFSCAKAPPATQNKLEGKLIRDLAYVQAIAHPYSDDADPEPEGAEVNLLWYDSKSELIFFKHIPIQITVEIFARKSHEYQFTELVYNGKTQIDSSASDIRIPFEDMKANPEIHNWGGHANLIVHTPQQGDFPIEDIVIPLFLYEKPPLKPPPTPTPEPIPTPAPAPTPTPESDAEQIEDLLREYYEAFSEYDVDRVGALIAEETLNSEGMEILEAVLFAKGINLKMELTAIDIQIDGDTAIAVTTLKTSLGSGDDTYKLVREDGNWKIHSKIPSSS